MISGSGDRHLMSEINVTPFVDVMLVLLIIFMVAAPMMTQGIDITLPKASTEPFPMKSDQLMITLTKDKKVFLNEVEVPMGLLGDKLNQIINREQVYLRADQSVPYGQVVYIMSVIKKAGINNIGVVTDPLEEDQI